MKQLNLPGIVTMPTEPLEQKNNDFILSQKQIKQLRTALEETKIKRAERGYIYLIKINDYVFQINWAPFFGSQKCICILHSPIGQYLGRIIGDKMHFSTNLKRKQVLQLLIALGQFTKWDALPASYQSIDTTTV